MISILRRNRSSLNFEKKIVHDQDTVFPLALTNYTQNHLIILTSKNKFVIQAMRGNKNLPNKQLTSNNLTGKPQSFPYRSRSNSRYFRETSRYRSPNTSSLTNSEPSLEMIFLNYQVGRAHPKNTKFSEKTQL